MSKHHKFIFVRLLDEISVFELAKLKEPPRSPDYGIACDCCQNQLEPIFDVYQMGFWEDKAVTLLVCRACNHAYWYAQTLSRIELEEISNDSHVERKVR